jgi:hypothetical protein
MAKTRNIYRILDWKPFKSNHIGNKNGGERVTVSWILGNRLLDVNCIKLAEDYVQVQTLVLVLLNLWIL